MAWGPALCHQVPPAQGALLGPQDRLKAAASPCPSAEPPTLHISPKGQEARGSAQATWNSQGPHPSQPSPEDARKAGGRRQPGGTPGGKGRRKRQQAEGQQWGDAHGPTSSDTAHGAAHAARTYPCQHTEPSLTAWAHGPSGSACSTPCRRHATCSSTHGSPAPAHLLPSPPTPGEGSHRHRRVQDPCQPATPGRHQQGRLGVMHQPCSRCEGVDLRVQDVCPSLCWRVLRHVTYTRVLRAATRLSPGHLSSSTVGRGHTGVT